MCTTALSSTSEQTSGQPMTTATRFSYYCIADDRPDPLSDPSARRLILRPTICP